MTNGIQQWLGKQSLLDDLASLDPALYQGLIFLKNYTGDPEELSLNFTVAEEGALQIVTRTTLQSYLNHNQSLVSQKPPIWYPMAATYQ